MMTMMFPVLPSPDSPVSQPSPSRVQPAGDVEEGGGEGGGGGGGGGLDGGGGPRAAQREEEEEHQGEGIGRRRWRSRHPEHGRHNGRKHKIGNESTPFKRE